MSNTVDFDEAEEDNVKDEAVKDDNKKITGDDSITSEDESTASAEAVAVVHICGAVKAPGVYEIALESRIADAVAAAGGLLDDANAEAVNLAGKVNDGEQIRIPFVGEEVVSVENSVNENVSANLGNSDEAATGKINLNTASKEQLMTLSGIGESKAEAIIKYRETNGSFTAIEDIMKIEGIKEGVFNKIKDDICVN